MTVRVEVTDDGFYVEDDGRGIPAGERERVFDPAHSTSEDGARFEVAGVDHAARRRS